MTGGAVTAPANPEPNSSATLRATQAREAEKHYFRRARRRAIKHLETRTKTPARRCRRLLPPYGTRARAARADRDLLDLGDLQCAAGDDDHHRLNALVRAAGSVVEPQGMPPEARASSTSITFAVLAPRQPDCNSTQYAGGPVKPELVFFDICGRPELNMNNGQCGAGRAAHERASCSARSRPPFLLDTHGTS